MSLKARKRNLFYINSKNVNLFMLYSLLNIYIYTYYISYLICVMYHISAVQYISILYIQYLVLYVIAYVVIYKTYHDNHFKCTV